MLTGCVLLLCFLSCLFTAVVLTAEATVHKELIKHRRDLTAERYQSGEGIRYTMEHSEDSLQQVEGIWNNVRSLQNR